MTHSVAEKNCAMSAKIRQGNLFKKDRVGGTANTRKKCFNSVNGLGTLLNPRSQFTEPRIPLSSTVDKTPTNFDIYSLRLYSLLPPHF